VPAGLVSEFAETLRMRAGRQRAITRRKSGKVNNENETPRRSRRLNDCLVTGRAQVSRPSLIRITMAALDENPPLPSKARTAVAAASKIAVPAFVVVDS